MEQNLRRAAGSEIVIRRSGSLPPQAALLLFTTFVLVSLVIATGFLLIGAWLVLPFAGLEVAVVAAVLGYLARHRSDRDVIAIDGDQVTVTRWRGRQRLETEFHRQWARVGLASAAHSWYPSRLWIRGHGNEVEVAAALDEEERREIAQHLEEVLGSAYRNNRVNGGNKNVAASSKT
jgi:uncharacterized membrane protein